MQDEISIQVFTCLGFLVKKPAESWAVWNLKRLSRCDTRAGKLHAGHGRHAPLWLRVRDVPAGPVWVLQEVPSARGMGAGQRLCAAAGQLTRRPPRQAAWHHQSDHLPSLQVKVSFMLTGLLFLWCVGWTFYLMTFFKSFFFSFPCRWESVGSPHRLAWYWLQILDKWTAEEVIL